MIFFGKFDAFSVNAEILTLYQKKMTTRDFSDDDASITVTDFLRCEFYFELAQALNCHPNDLQSALSKDRDRFKECLHYTLKHSVSPQCRREIRHIVSELM